MDLSAVNANTTTSTDLFTQRRTSTQVTDPGVRPNDFATTQVNLANLQGDLPIQPSAAGPANTQQNPWQSTLKTDLSNLTNTVQQGDSGPSQSGWQPVQQENPAAPAGMAEQSNNQFLNSLASLLNSVVFGVQTAAATLQQDFQNAFGTATSNTATSPITTQSINAPTASGPSQSSFMGDLQALIAAAGSNDTVGLQTAANNLAQDLHGTAGATAFNAKAFFEQIDREGRSG